MSEYGTLFNFLVLVSGAIAIWLIVMTILTEQHMRMLHQDVLKKHDDWLAGFIQEERDYADDLLKEFLEEEDAP